MNGSISMPARARRKRWIFALTAFLLVALALLGWVFFQRVDKEAEVTLAVRTMRSITVTCITYAADSDGNYPEQLQSLVPEYVDWPGLFLMVDAETGKPATVFYRQPSPHARYRREVMLISPPLRRKNCRVIGFSNGSVNVVRLTTEELEKAKRGVFAR